MTTNQGLRMGDRLLATLEVQAGVVEAEDYLRAGDESQPLPELHGDDQSASLADSCHSLAHLPILLHVRPAPDRGTAGELTAPGPRVAPPATYGRSAGRRAATSVAS